MPLAWMMILLALTGCEQFKTEKEIDGYHEGFRKDPAVVLSMGTGGRAKSGGFAVEAPISSGPDLGPHSTVIALAICCGMLGGIVLQYFVLLVGISHESINTFWMAWLVPGSKYSEAFGLIMRRRQFVLQSEERISSLRAVNEIRFTKLLADQAFKEREIAVASSIDELFQARLLTLAEVELTAIVTDSEEYARVRKSKVDTFKNKSYAVTSCPYCSKRIGFRSGTFSKRVTCPHEQCRKEFELPTQH